MRNKEKLFSIALVSVSLIFMLSTALASTSHPVDDHLTLTETRITTNKSAQTCPAIYGDRIV